MTMKSTGTSQTLSDEILKNTQQKMIGYTDPETGEVKSGPRFVLRGFKFLKPEQSQPDKIYFDGNKTYEKLRSEGKNVQTVVHALFMRARMMKNYCSELKIYDNQAEPGQQLIYDYISGMHEHKTLLDLYLTFKKV